MMGTSPAIDSRGDMFVTTQDGVITNLRWWTEVRVTEPVKDKIIVNAIREDEEVQVLTIAELDEEVIQQLFKDLNDAIAYKAAFDVPAWIEAWEPAVGE